MRKVPFTALMLVVVAAAGVWSVSVLHPLSPALTERWGFAPADLQHPLEWWRIVASALVTTGRRAFFEALLALALVTGMTEWRAGTAWAAVGFWGGHVGSVLVESLLVALPMWWLGWPLGKELATVPGVGASAAYVGSLGLLVALLPRRFSLPVAGVTILALLVRVLPPSSAAADLRALSLTDGIVHLLAFVGVYSARMLWQRRQERVACLGEPVDPAV